MIFITKLQYVIFNTTLLEHRLFSLQFMNFHYQIYICKFAIENSKIPFKFADKKFSLENLKFLR